MEDNIDFDLNLPTENDRRMEEMLSEVKFPLLGPPGFEFTPLKGMPYFENGEMVDSRNEPTVGSYVLVYTERYEKTIFGIYKWREDNNPVDIVGWTYLNIESTMVGRVRYVPYKHLKHDSIILICDENFQNEIVKEKEPKQPDVGTASVATGGVTFTVGTPCDPDKPGYNVNGFLDPDCEHIPIEVKPKPKPQKATTFNFRSDTFLKDIIETPKKR